MARPPIAVQDGMSIVIALVAVLLLVGLVLPPVIGAFHADDTTQLQQLETEEEAVTSYLNATIITIDTTNEQIDVGLEDERTGETVTVTDLDEGTNETVTINDRDVQVEHTTYDDNEPTVTYTMPSTFDWADGVTSVFAVMDLIAMLIVLLLMVAWALRYT